MDNSSGSGWLTSLLIAILSGLGIGSGGLLVIWLTLIEGIDAETARGLNLLFFVFSASTALIVHLLMKRIKPSLVLFLATLTCVGTLIGLSLSKFIDPTWLKKIFGGMLVVSGVYTLVGNVTDGIKKKKPRIRADDLKFLFVGMRG